MELILDLIDIHNKHVDKMIELGNTLFHSNPDVANTPVDQAFSEAYNGVIMNAISLCCEINSYDDCKWMTDEDWHVVKEKVEG